MTTEETNIVIKEDGQLITQGHDLVETAMAFEIKDDLTCNQAVEIGKLMKEFVAGPGAYHDEEIDVANKLHKLLCGKRNAIVDPVTKAYKVIKKRIALHIEAERQKRAEAQRQAEAEAARKEKEKQAKIQAKIDEENRKIAKAKEKEAAIQAEKDAAIQKEKDLKKATEMKLEEEARKQEQARIDRENARKAREKAQYLKEKKADVYVPPAVIAPTSVPAGASVRYTWEPTVTNKALVPDQYKTVDLSALKKTMASWKGQGTIPGVRFTKTPIGTIRK